MGPAAILSALLSVDGDRAFAEMRKFDETFRRTKTEAEKGIEAKLGGAFNPEAFQRYLEFADRAARRTADRKAFRAQLGADFNYAGFAAYERAIDKANRDSAHLAEQQRKSQWTVGNAANRFFTGGSNAEERSFFRGTLRGAVGHGAGFLGGGLAGGLLGYVSATGIKDSIESTTQMVRQAEILSRSTGISQQNAQALEAVSGALGVSSRGLGVGFRTLATAANNALTDPTKATVRAFKELGISEKELKANSGDMQATFGLVADRLNKLPEGTEKTALAAKLLGRNWQTLAPLIEQGSKGMQEQIAQAKALGVTLGGDPVKNMQKLHEAEINLKLAQEGLSVQFTEHVAPALISVTMGAIKLAESVRRDLTPVFNDLSPVVKDAGHWLEQNKSVVEGLVIAFAGLKVVRTVGGWFYGLGKDIESVWKFGAKLAGMFTAQAEAASTEAVSINELAAAQERLAIAQKNTAAGGTAAGAAPVWAWALPVAAAAIPAYGIIKGAQGQHLGGLANRLGAVPGTGGVTGAARGGLESIFPFASRFFDSNYAQLSAAEKQLKSFQAGLKGVQSATELTDAQLRQYRAQALSLARLPDLTARQRSDLRRLAGMLNPTTVAFERATAQWTSTFAGFDATTGSMSQHFRDQLAQDSHQIAQNWVSGTKHWTQQTQALIAASWQQIGQMNAQGVSGVAGDIQSLVAMIEKMQITQTKAGASWLNSVQGNLSSLGLDKALQRANAAGGHLPGGGWPSSHHARARHAAARNEYWDPFTGAYELMTSAQHSALRNQYISMYGVAPASGPSHRHAATAHQRAASRAQQILAKSLGAQSAGGFGNVVNAPSQAAWLQIQLAQAANNLQAAQNANNTAGQFSALHRQLGLDRHGLALDTSKVAEIRGLLRTHLSATRRAALMQDMLTILQDIGSLQNQIGSAKSSLQSLTSGTGSGSFDLAPGGAGIKLPTVYDTRRAMVAAGHDRHFHVHINAPIHVDAHHDEDDIIATVADAFERELRGPIKAKLRPSGPGHR